MAAAMAPSQKTIKFRLRLALIVTMLKSLIKVCKPQQDRKRVERLFNCLCEKVMFSLALVCLLVCLSVSNITPNVMDGF